MNNYLSLNLVNGRLGRAAGGGRPKFVLDEQNEVQLYVLDFPKPSTYPPSSLSDAYAYEIIPRDFSGSSVTLKAGVRGGSPIISTNSLFNLPTNLVLSSSANAYFYILDSRSSIFVGNIIQSGEFSISTIPVSGSIFSFTVTVTVNGLYSRTVTSATFSLDNRLSDIGETLRRAMDIANQIFSNSNANCQVFLGKETDSGFYGGQTEFSFFQSSDYSYSFNYTKPLIPRTIGSPTNLNSVLVSVSLNNVRASSNPGKYGYLDFSSSSWDSVIGTKVETPIWMEAMIGSDTIAQGNAIICRKMT